MGKIYNDKFTNVPAIKRPTSAKKVLNVQHIAFEQAKFTTIIGPNGAGKTTLLKALSGNNDATNSTVFYQDRSLNDLNGQWLAQQRAMLSQHSQIAFPLKVKELVQLGREPYPQQ